MKIRFMRPHLNLSLCVLCVLAAFLNGQAQSGRRAPKPISPPTTTTTAPPKEPERPSPAPQNKLALKPQTLIVALDDRSAAGYIPQYMSDAILRGFLGKFKERSSITITLDRNMRRKQAVERAKKETENFVVLLQLGTNQMGGGLGDVSPEGLIVGYVVFTPGTAKIKDQGRVYVRPSRSILGQRIPTARTVDAQLNEAGRETASRVLSALQDESPAIRR